MKPESRFWSRIKKKFPTGHLIRVENPVLPGTPDVNFCWQGREIWFELKFEPGLPKRKETAVFTRALRPEQVLWLKTRSYYGGECYILAGVPDENGKDMVFCISGKFAEKFNSMTLEELTAQNIPLEKVFADDRPDL